MSGGGTISIREQLKAFGSEFQRIIGGAAGLDSSAFEHVLANDYVSIRVNLEKNMLMILKCTVKYEIVHHNARWRVFFQYPDRRELHKFWHAKELHEITLPIINEFMQFQKDMASGNEVVYGKQSVLILNVLSRILRLLDADGTSIPMDVADLAQGLVREIKKKPSFVPQKPDDKI